MRLLASAVLSVCLGTAGFSSAAEPAQVGKAATEEPGAEKPRIICERITRIGTRIPERVCRTEAQLEQERAAAKRWTSNRQDDAAKSGGLPPALSPGPG